MKIEITDKTPNTSVLELVKINDVYGSVVITRGWQ